MKGRMQKISSQSDSCPQKNRTESERLSECRLLLG